MHDDFTGAQGKQSCSLISKLTLDCEKHRYKRSGTVCILKAGDQNPQQVDLNVILGGLIGAVAAACVALLLFYVKKHPQRAMKAR